VDNKASVSILQITDLRQQKNRNLSGWRDFSHLLSIC